MKANARTAESGVTMNIVHSIDIQSAPERLFDAITTQRGIAGWWTPHTRARPVVGTLNEVAFNPGEKLCFRVDELEPATHVAWSAVHVPPAWQGTRLIFDLSPAEDATNLAFIHSGLSPEHADFGFFNYCWAQYIRSLKLLLETGIGEPFGSPAAKAWHPLNPCHPPRPLSAEFNPWPSV